MASQKIRIQISIYPKTHNMKFVALHFFLLLSGFVTAQIPEYYVYLVKGDIKIVHLKSKPVLLKQNSLVFKDDELILTKNSEVTLVNRDSKYLVINKEGKTKIRELLQGRHDTYTGVTKKYLQLLWHELLDPNYDYSKFKLQNIAGVYGGVSRGDEDCKNLIFPISGLKTSSDSVQFIWKKSNPNNNYNLFIYDVTGKEVFSKTLRDTQFIISLSKNLLLAKGKYVWLIKEAIPGCEEGTPHVFEIITKEQEQKIIDSYSKDAVNPNLILQLQLIDRLEKNKLIYAAIRKYEALMKEYPHNSTLKKIYYIFLSEYGFIKKAEEVWNNILNKKY